MNVDDQEDFAIRLIVSCHVVQVKVEDDSRWVAEPQAGCVVLTEGDPPPGAHFGHMSFSSFNSELQKLQVHVAPLPPLAHCMCS